MVMLKFSKIFAYVLIVFFSVSLQAMKKSEHTISKKPPNIFSTDYGPLKLAYLKAGGSPAATMLVVKTFPSDNLVLEKFNFALSKGKDIKKIINDQNEKELENYKNEIDKHLDMEAVN